MNDFYTIKIKVSTKEMLDEYKERTGKMLWFIVDEAIKEYCENHRKD